MASTASGGSMKNEDLVKKFINATKSEKNLAARTLKAYTSDLNAFVKFAGIRRMIDFEIDKIREYINWLEEKGLCDSSIRRHLATVKLLYNFLEEEGIIEYSPARELKRRYKVALRLPRIMSHDEIKRLLSVLYISIINIRLKSGFKYFKTVRDCAIIEMLFSTGMRIDEVTKLDIDHLNLGRRAVLIMGKGRKERLLYISSDEVMLSIEEYLNLRESYHPETNALFLNRYHRRLSVHSIGKIFNEYCRKAQINRKITPHCLRHTMATMLIENGADVRSVQEILGHSSISTTEIYLSISKQRKMEVLSKFHERNHFHLRSF
jgi:integrase/recombinase XerD